MPSRPGPAVPIVSMPVPKVSPKYVPAAAATGSHVGAVASASMPNPDGIMPTRAAASMRGAGGVASGYEPPAPGSLLSMLATRGRYVEDAVHAEENPPLPTPSMPKSAGVRVKAGPPPAEPREHVSDAGSGRFQDVPGESTRENFRQRFFHGSRGLQNMADRRKSQNFGALPHFLTDEIWNALNAGSREENINRLLAHSWSLGLRCPSEGTFSTIYNIVEAVGRDPGRSRGAFERYEAISQLKKSWRQYKIVRRHEDFQYQEYLLVLPSDPRDLPAEYYLAAFVTDLPVPSRLDMNNFLMAVGSTRLRWRDAMGGSANAVSSKEPEQATQDAANGKAPAEVPVEPEVDDAHADQLVHALGEEDALPEGDVEEFADQTDQQEAMQEETPEEVSLTNGMGKLQTAMQKRDTKKAAMKKPAASAALQAKPKGKAMKATKKASVMKSHVKAAAKAKAKTCPKSKTMPQAKACPNVKAAAKKKAAPRQLKMTRTCVYSRAYHVEASAWVFN
eukprot:s2248_g2.t1